MSLKWSCQQLTHTTNNKIKFFRLAGQVKANQQFYPMHTNSNYIMCVLKCIMSINKGILVSPVVPKSNITTTNSRLKCNTKNQETKDPNKYTKKVKTQITQK